MLKFIFGNTVKSENWIQAKKGGTVTFYDHAATGKLYPLNYAFTLFCNFEEWNYHYLKGLLILNAKSKTTWQ